MHLRSSTWIVLLGAVGCVPAGSGAPQDAGIAAAPATARQQVPNSIPTPAALLLKGPFEDDFEHGTPAASSGSVAQSSVNDGEPALGPSARLEPSSEWIATVPGIWHIESGRLCAEHAHNHGLWLKHALPVNARIEFDAVSQSSDGDLKAEYWGDGRSAATGLSYTNATSYLTILGGWHNKIHVLARLNEHGTDRKEVVVDPHSDDPRERAIVPGQIYHFKVERSDGRTVRWWVDGNEMLTYPDPAPLTGMGHDHFGFNDWDAKVCFDNVRVVPLP